MRTYFPLVMVALMVETIGGMWRLVVIGGDWERLGRFNAWENPKTLPHANTLSDSACTSETVRTNEYSDRLLSVAASSAPPNT